MKKKKRKALGHYIRWIADEMGLRDWHFELYVEESKIPDMNMPDDAYCIASCKPIIGRKLAELRFDPSVKYAPPEDLRKTVCHELEHCHFFGMWDMIRRDLLDHFSEQAYDILIAGIERHMEYGIDASADAIAKHMPLIDWNNTGDEEYEVVK